MPDNAPPPNPFESPQAVDPPTQKENWRPTARIVVWGLLITPAIPALIVISALQIYSWFVSQEALPYEDIAGPAAGFYMWTAIFHAPCILVLQKLGKLTPRTTLEVLSSVNAVVVVVYIAIIGTMVEFPADEVLFELARIAVVMFLFLSLEVIVFALYLAHLRRRDLRRAISSLQ